MTVPKSPTATQDIQLDFLLNSLAKESSYVTIVSVDPQPQVSDSESIVSNTTSNPFVSLMDTTNPFQVQSLFLTTNPFRSEEEERNEKNDENGDRSDNSIKVSRRL